MNIIEMIGKTLDGMLDTAYLFNENQKRVRENLKFLIVALLGCGVVDGGLAMLAHGPMNVWLGVIITIALGAGALVMTGKVRAVKQMHLLVSIYILLNMWLQFIFYSAYVNYILLMIYPFLICFLLGNSYSLRFLPLLFANLLVCTWGWRDALDIFSEVKPYVYLHLVVGFLCSCLLALALEYVHARTIAHLTSLTNKITDNSYTDPLTRLLTRRAFNERFASQLEEQASTGKPLFCIMCDIDHFKSVNDNYGHQTGDDVLKHVSGILSKYAVGKDLCFRWGGEEFLIFLHEKSLQKAVDATNRIRVVLEYTPFLSSISGVIKVTMSFGLHQYDTTMSMDKNISVADGYLYAAKHNGRNRVEHA